MAPLRVYNHEILFSAILNDFSSIWVRKERPTVYRSGFEMYYEVERRKYLFCYRGILVKEISFEEAARSLYDRVIKRSIFNEEDIETVLTIETLAGF